MATRCLVVQAALLSVTSSTLDVVGGMAIGMGITMFATAFPKYGLVGSAGTHLYCPLGLTFRKIDGLILRVEGSVAILFPLKIMPDTSQFKFEAIFFAEWSKWVQGLYAYQISVRFIYITESGIRSTEDIAAGLHSTSGIGNKSTSPSYRRHIVPLENINKGLVEAMALARAQRRPTQVTGFSRNV